MALAICLDFHLNHYMENDLLNNKFVSAFINEYDAYLYAHPEVRQNAGLILYKPQNSRSKYNIDKHSYSNEDKLLLIAIIQGKKQLDLINNIHYSDIINSDIPSATKKYLLEQWNDLIGDSNSTHSRIIYRMLQNRNIPANVLIPLLIKIGVSNEVCQDRDLPESDFISKYDGLLWLIPTSMNADESEAICKLLSLNIVPYVNNSIPKTGHSISDYEDEAVVEFALLFSVIRSEYSLEYEQFLNCDFSKAKETDIPPISLLRQFSRIEQCPELLYEPIFEAAHTNTYLESRGAIEFIISTGAKVPVFIEAYEHYCIQYGLSPINEIVNSKSRQNQLAPKDEFVEQYNACEIDSSNKSHLNLSLTGEAIYNLYNIVKNGYINEHQVSLSQFCYALTGRMRPPKIEQIEWISNTNDFAIFVNLIYQSRRKPASQLCDIFRFQDPQFDPYALSSRCSRLEKNNQNQGFQNQILAAIKYK